MSLRPCRVIFQKPVDRLIESEDGKGKASRAVEPILFHDCDVTEIGFLSVVCEFSCRIAECAVEKQRTVDVCAEKILEQRIFILDFRIHHGLRSGFSAFFKGEVRRIVFPCKGDCIGGERTEKQCCQNAAH